jgi:hypothetical protein
VRHALTSAVFLRSALVAQKAHVKGLTCWWPTTLRILWLVVVTMTGRPFDRLELESRLRQHLGEASQLEECAIQKMIMYHAAALPLMTPSELCEVYEEFIMLPYTATRADLMSKQDLALIGNAR